MTLESPDYVRWFDDLTREDIAEVGGKNASLGEMIGHLRDEGIRIPDGFALTADAYRAFFAANDLDARIREQLDDFSEGAASLESTGRRIRALFDDALLPEAVVDALEHGYGELSRRYGTVGLGVAVRSSATAEDSGEASFAGQQETFLNVTGEQALLEACRACFASMFTDRAIAYREKQGFDHLEAAMSVGIQKMVRADRGGAGVAFTLHPETGFPDIVLINAAWGLGDNVVQGTIDPDQYAVYKPFLDRDDLRPVVDKQLGAKRQKSVYADSVDERLDDVETSLEERDRFVLSDDEILKLARWSRAIEDHYGRPMDVEWAKDGETGELYVVQARPETVQARKRADTMETYSLTEDGERLVEGLAIGQAAATGPVCVIEETDQMDQFEPGSVLVTDMTDPDWVPVMEQAAGIVTNRGGRTSHAAIVSRELGIPAIIGTGDATETLDNDRTVTLSCVEGDAGYVYDGALDFETEAIDLNGVPEPETRIMMNVASPAGAMRWWRLPAHGVGLARMEYIINRAIQIHPLALSRFDEVDDEEARERIEHLTRHYDDKREYFVDHLARGVGAIAAAHHPEPVVVRMSDFKSNEYAELVGGRGFEPEEANPMLGWRGASRYYSDAYRDGFAMECRALRRAREELGFENVVAMIPFCRTPDEAERVLEVMAEHDLERGKNGLEIYMMAEIPTNIIEIDAFAPRFDGISIGSNDLTQLTMGVDRDSEKLSYLFDACNDSVKWLIRRLVDRAHDHDCKVGICGEAPSNHPEFAAFLVEQGIDSISLNPDSVLPVIERVADIEERLHAANTETEPLEAATGE